MCFMFGSIEAAVGLGGVLEMVSSQRHGSGVPVWSSFGAGGAGSSIMLGEAVLA